MSRPYYCTAADNRREAEVLALLCARLSVDSMRFNQDRTYEVKLAGDARNNPYDGEVYVNGKLFALVEIKCRNGQSDRYADWHMAQHKINRNRAAAAAKNVPLWLVYRWDDGCFMADAAKLDLSKTRIGGRTDRNDPYDTEVMTILDRSKFARI